MKARAVAVGTALAIGWAGCGLTSVGSFEEPPVPVPQVDATAASVTETGTVDTATPPVPAPGSEVPIVELDASTGIDATVDATVDDAATKPPFEVVAPQGGAFRMIPPGDILPCSVGGIGPANLNVKNFGDTSVSLRWVNYACNEVSYGVLPGNRQSTIGTYDGHRWRIRGADGGILGDFVIDAPGGTYTAIVR